MDIQEYTVTMSEGDIVISDSDGNEAMLMGGLIAEKLQAKYGSKKNLYFASSGEALKVGVAFDLRRRYYELKHYSMDHWIPCDARKVFKYERAVHLMFESIYPHWMGEKEVFDISTTENCKSVVEGIRQDVKTEFQLRRMLWSYSNQHPELTNLEKVLSKV